MEIVSSYQLKAALMWYWRYKRNIICAPELHNGDVVNYDIPFIHEIEIKISKSDLWNGEARKDKHISYANGKYRWGTQGMPNKFSVCVPNRLIDTAKDWVKSTNKKYGIISLVGDNPYDVWIIESAKYIHKEIDKRFSYSLLRKLSSIAVEDYADKYLRIEPKHQPSSTVD